jgi:hypothetical protein
VQEQADEIEADDVATPIRVSSDSFAYNQAFR